MSNIDPYKAGLFKSNPYAKKSDINGKLVVVLDGKMENRGLQLIPQISRCLQKNQIHELIITDEDCAQPGNTVNAISYLGFFEVEQGGVMVVDDQIYLDNILLGKIAGFDETHMPNHLNIVIKCNERLTGIEKKAEVGSRIIVRLP